ncbi:5-formyltetrahydrofolate cyclo-ligase [Paraglaciecola sp.]|uniref:5-formyltetrahydrofolate cyclo-ligase n=1 Tax=Paraglaciecola sp. TaxID=1920173 RepID=UPI0030F38E97
MPDTPTAQNMLRRQFRALRQQLTDAQQEQAAHALLTKCLNAPAVCAANTIACYLTNDGEINPKYLIEWCWQQHKSVLLPILHPTLPGHLVFIEYQSNSLMIKNKYGIPEPEYMAEKVVTLSNIDIIFTPLVAFDSTGNRLGMGGGYYDRTLASLSHQPHATQVLGLAHDCQQAATLPIQSWDIPLHGIITPSQIFTLKGSV